MKISQKEDEANLRADTSFSSRYLYADDTTLSYIGRSVEKVFFCSQQDGK